MPFSLDVLNYICRHGRISDEMKLQSFLGNTYGVAKGGASNCNS